MRNYGAGSLTTAVAPNLPVLIVGWSALEGIGAALILPAIVSLVAGNFAPEGRPRASGLLMAAGAVAVAIGPLIGGIATTYFSWRYVFVGEVLVVIAILFLARRVQDAPVGTRIRLDVVGAALSAAGLGIAVFGVLRSSVWGWVLPKPGGAAILGLSPTIVLILGGVLVLWLFSVWEHYVDTQGREPLVRLSMLGNRQFSGGLVMFFFQFLIQAGLFFPIPLYLSVALGLSAIDTGVRIIPLSITLLLAAAGIPRFFPNISPRLVVQGGLLAMFAGIVWLFMSIDAQAGAQIVTVPLLLAGLGIGARLAARQRHRLRRPRRSEPGSRRPAEHRDQSRCLDRHSARGLAAHRCSHHLVPGRHQRQPGSPRAGQRAGRRPTSQRDPVPVRPRPQDSAHQSRREHRCHPGCPAREQPGSTRRAAHRPRRARPHCAGRSVPVHPHPHPAAAI